MANAKMDENSRNTLTAVSYVDGSIVQLWADPVTHRLLVDLPTSGGTVTSVSVASVNGFAGTVATATTTPVITISTTVTGLLKGNGTAISAAVAGTDYLTPTGSAAALTSFPTLNQNTTGTASNVTGVVAIANGGTNTGSQATGGVTYFDGTIITSTSELIYTPLGTVNKFGIIRTATTTATSPIVFGFSSGGLNHGGANQTWFTISPIIAQSGTGGYTSFLVNTTETSTGSGVKILADFQLGGISKVKVDNTGNTTIMGNIELGNASDTTISRSSAGVIAVEGVIVPTETSTNTLINKTLTTPVINQVNASANTSIKLNAGTYNAIQTYTPSASGTATLDLSKGNIHHITMPAGNITIALSNESAGQCFIVRILQDGTGSRTVTWFSTIKWAGGTAPTLTTTASKADTFGFEVTSAGNYDGFVVGQSI